MKIMINGITLFSIVLFSCVFDPDIALVNDKPQCTSHRSIVKCIYYPESIVCTLSVTDLNDASLKALVCPESDSSLSSASDTFLWYGNCTLLQENYNIKKLAISLDTNLMGLYSGVLLITDSYGAYAGLPFEINNIFCDSFDSPDLSGYWNNYITGDTNAINFDFTDRKLQFLFSESDNILSDGIRSAFRISGDFSITVDLKLRDEMTDGFETSFFISNSQDTGRWGVKTGGIFLSGKQNQLILECRSVNLQSYIIDEDRNSGKLGMTRQGSKLSFFYTDGDPRIKPQPITTHEYYADSAVYVHLRMKVSELSKTRHCLWNNFMVVKGSLEL